MANKITKAERDQINRRAAELLSDNIFPAAVTAKLVAEYGITRDRASRAVSKAMMTRNRPGAPAGNDNAARKDGRPRVPLNVRVEQVTLDWLQAKADATTAGNVGRWLDQIAQQ